MWFCEKKHHTLHDTYAILIITGVVLIMAGIWVAMKMIGRGGDTEVEKEEC